MILLLQNYTSNMAIAQCFIFKQRQYFSLTAYYFLHITVPKFCVLYEVSTFFAWIEIVPQISPSSSSNLMLEH